MRGVGHVARMGDGRGEDNIKMDLREIGIDGVYWIRLAQDRIQWRTSVNTVMKIRIT
jgi:hypothetical protein